MADADLGEILRSPLDESDPPIRWFPFLGGIVVGGLVAIAAYLVADPGPTTAVVVAPTTTAAPGTTLADEAQPPTDAGTAAFPAGYTEVTEVIALKPLYAMRVDDDLVMAVDSVARRGLDPVAGFGGEGRWVLQTADGAEVEASSLTTDVFLGGSFSLTFPGIGESEPRTLLLTEVWEGEAFSGSAVVDVGPELGEIGDVGVPFAGGLVVDVTGLELTEADGSFSWSISGDELTSSMFPAVWARSGAGSQDEALWTPSGDQPGFSFMQRRQLVAVDGGDVALQRSRDFQGDLSGVDSVAVTIDVTVIVPLPADVSWDLAELPIVTL